MTVRARREAPSRAPERRRAPEARGRAASPVPSAGTIAAMRRRAGLVWIPVIAALLGGIVWVNVAKLRVTRQTSAVVQQSQRVEEESRRLAARLGKSDGSVGTRAEARLNMRLPAEGEVKPLDPVVR